MRELRNWVMKCDRQVAKIDSLTAENKRLREACEYSMRSQHHPLCPIATGRGQTTVTRDDCTCHVEKARTALAERRRKS